MITRKSQTLLITSLLAASVLFTNLGHATSYAPFPETVEDYIETSDIIVVGRIGKIQKIHTFYGYQDSAAELERLDPLTPISLGYPMVDYEVVIEEVVKADELLLSRPNAPVIFRVLQGHGPREAGIAYRENQGRFMLFLVRNSDNETYGIYSFAHKVNLETDKPSYSFEGKQWSILPDASTADEFLSAVKSAARP